MGQYDSVEVEVVSDDEVLVSVDSVEVVLVEDDLREVDKKVLWWDYTILFTFKSYSHDYKKASKYYLSIEGMTLVYLSISERK